MVFDNKKRYFKEKKTSMNVKKKIEHDTLRKNIKQFTYEDIAKTTKFSRRAPKVMPKKDKKTIPSYNTTKEKNHYLTAYGTYLETEGKEQQANTNKKHNMVTKSNRFNERSKKISSKKSKRSPEFTTIDEYYTEQYLKRKALREARKKTKSTTELNTAFNPPKRKIGLRKTHDIKIENRENIENTLDALLRKIPTED